MSTDAVSRRGVLAGGNWIIDHVKLIDAWPPQDSLADIIDRSTGNGGSPYNVLKNLALLRAPFPLAGIGLVGDDADGRRILDDCRAHGIDLTQLRVTAAAPTSYTDVMTVRDTGRRTFFHDRGANARLAPGHFDFGATPAKHFHLGYLLLLDALDAPGTDGRPGAAEVLARARTAGMRTSVDCVSARADRFETTVAPVLPEVDLLFVNDYEAEQLTGLALGRGVALDRAATERVAKALLARGVREWAVIHFPEGAVAGSAAGEIVWQPGVQVPPDEIRGAAGAGDAFVAGVLYGLHEAWPMARALELGVSAGAASLRSPTCSGSVVAAAECLALAGGFGFHPPLPVSGH